MRASTCDNRSTRVRIIIRRRALAKRLLYLAAALTILAVAGLSAACFGDGTWRVGSDVAPGTYRAANTSAGCYWERLSGFGGTMDEVIANNFTSDPDVVTIAPTDVGFSSEGCGIWTENLAAITASPTAPFGAGTFIVGVDIAPGTWRNSDSSSGCYWARLSGFSGTMDDIIANNYSNSAEMVTIATGDAGFASSSCGTWTKVQ